MKEIFAAIVLAYAGLSFVMMVGCEPSVAAASAPEVREEERALYIRTTGDDGDQVYENIRSTDARQ